MASRKVRRTPKPKLLNAIATEMNITPRTARHVLDAVLAVFQRELGRTKSGTIRIKVPDLTGYNGIQKILQIVDEGPARKTRSRS